jgi:hypothetical protein
LVGFVIPGFTEVYKSGNVPDENNSTFTLEEAGIDRKLSSRAQKLSEYEVRAERKLGEILKAAKAAGQRIIKKNASGFLHSEKKMVSGA